MGGPGVAETIFGLSLVATFVIALSGRMASRRDVADSDLAGRDLNKWLVGFSAAATGNSGFIVTGAVGMGYVSGLYGVLFPLGWLFGDLLFWFLIPERLNRLARNNDSTTLAELLGHGLTGPASRLFRVLVAVILMVFLATYTSAQWLAGQKFLSTAFAFNEYGAFFLFSVTIVAYSTLGGFRGSVYVDTMQAVISLVCTALAVAVVISFALGDRAGFEANMATTSTEFFSLMPAGQITAGLGVLLGFAGAAFGFSLSQPQVMTRYFAASSPEETRGARWIYIGFVQFTWISMVLFGAVLRGVIPDIGDPETGLIEFFSRLAHPVLAGLIFAYIYAIIGSTANSIIVAVSQSIKRDILSGGAEGSAEQSTPFWIIGAVGVATIILSFALVGNVFTIATVSFSTVGAAIAGSVLIKVFDWRHSAGSLTMAVLSGLVAAYAWDAWGLDAFLNVAGVGIVVSLGVNWLYCILLLPSVHDDSIAGATPHNK